VPSILNLHDYEAAAQERLPQMVFDYFAGGANDELTLGENLAAWDRLRFRPRLPWYRTLAAYAAGTLVFVVLFMSAPMMWLVSGLRRRKRREITQHRWVKTVSGLGALVGLLNLGFLVGVPLELLPYAGLNGTQLDFGAPSSLVVLFAIPLVTAALAVMLAAAGIQAWRAKTGTVLARTYFAAIIGAALLFPDFLSYWSLLGLIS